MEKGDLAGNAVDRLLPENVSDGYELISPLGGGRRHRFLASDKMTQRQYVVTFAAAEDIESVRREHRLLSRLHGPAFPHTLFCLPEGDGAVWAREYVPGITLREWVRQNGPFSAGEARALILEVISIISTLHAFNPPVAHLDISAERFVRDEQGCLHLVDFRHAEESAPFSPEACRAPDATPEKSAGCAFGVRTDVYLIGALAVYLLTGTSEPAQMKKRRVPRQMRRTIEKCLQYDPRKRFGSVHEIARALRAPRGRRIALGAAAAIVLLAAALAAANPAVQSAARTLSVVAGSVRFSSPLIEAAVRAQLNRPDGIVVPEDLSAIQSLLLCGETPYRDFYDLNTYGEQQMLLGENLYARGALENARDLERMASLTRLSLSRIDISDFTFLQKLDLTHLCLSGDGLTDLSVLSGMKNLENLDVADNDFSDISPILSLEKLRVLNLSATKLKNTDGLEALNLESLSLYDMQPGFDFSGVGRLTTLTRFGTREADPDILSDLGKIPGLKDITVFYSGVKSLEPLFALSDPEAINLPGNELTSLEGIGRFSNLRFLDFGSNQVTSLEPLRGNQTIEWLGVNENPVTDLSPLSEMPNLKTLVISEDQAALAKSLPETIGIQISGG